MNRVRYFLAILLTAIVLVFALQNLHAVSVTLLLWDFATSVTLIVLGPFLVGLLAGIVLTLVAARRKRDVESDRDQPDITPPADATAQ